MATRNISLEQLQPGMYVAKLDVSWWRSPFLRHAFLVTTQAQIDRLRRAGITQVLIDLSRGDDLPPPPRTGTAASSSVSTASPLLGENGPKSLEQLNREYREAKQARAHLEHTVRGIFDSLTKQGTLNARQAAEAAQEICIVTRTLPTSAVFMALSAERAADPSLAQHALSTCTLAMLLGQSLSYNPLELQELAMAALLHDIGLLQLPASMVQRSANTSTPLPLREREIFESHPQRSILALERRGGFDATMLQLIGEHHVRLNGSGFPEGMLGEFTSERSRVLAIADYYEELTSGFGGASPLAPYQALQRLYQEGQEGLLDRTVISRLIKLVGIYPVYSHVRLNTRETAIVTHLNPDALHQPIVTITHASNSEPVTPPLQIDLAQQDPAGPLRAIEMVLTPTVDTPAPPDRRAA